MLSLVTQKLFSAGTGHEEAEPNGVLVGIASEFPASKVLTAASAQSSGPAAKQGRLAA